MRFWLSPKAERQYRRAPKDVQRAFDKQVLLLVENSRHPSLDAKKYKGTYQARVTLSWRFYFDLNDDTYEIHSITKHP